MRTYPPDPHIRKHGPSGFVKYQSFKPWLRDEFSFRCIYCLEREQWYPNGHQAFGVDHAKPKGDHLFAALECDYNNLLYACNRCNSAKGSAELMDPTKTAFGDHITIDIDGQIRGLSRDGRFLISVLRLDDEWVTQTRRTYLQIASLYQRYTGDPDVAELYFDAFGFPPDLPDLTVLRPPNNDRPAGLEQCYWVLHSRNALDRVYGT